MNKTLVCILAETRAHKLSWDSFNSNILEKLDADLALCIAVDETYDYENPYWKSAKFKFTFKEHSDWGDAYDECQLEILGKAESLSLPNWRLLLEVKDQWLGGVKGPNSHPGSAGILIYARWQLLKSLLENNLDSAYDRFIVTRSDFIWTIPHPDLEILDERKIWVPDGEAYGGITDRHVVLSREHLSSYLSCLGEILSYPDKTKKLMSHRNDWNLERFLLYYLKRNKCQHLIARFPYLMYTAREKSGSTSWSKGTWSDEEGCYIKYDSEYQCARSIKKVFKAVHTWNELILKNSTTACFDSFVCTRNYSYIKKFNKTFATGMAPSAQHQSFLTIDITGPEGALYESVTHKYRGERCLRNYGLNRILLDKVEIRNRSAECFELYSESQRSYYYIDRNGFLQLDTENKLTVPYIFRIKNRYVPQRKSLTETMLGIFYAKLEFLDKPIAKLELLLKLLLYPRIK